MSEVRARLVRDPAPPLRVEIHKREETFTAHRDLGGALYLSIEAQSAMSPFTPRRASISVSLEQLREFVELCEELLR